MSFGDSIREAVGIYRELLLQAEGRAVDTSAVRVSGNKPGTIPPAWADTPAAVEMERQLGRFVTVWRNRLQAEQAPSAGDRRSAAKRSTDAAILAAVGADPTELAYLHGRTTEGVRKLRLRRGLDPDTGERARRPSPITSRDLPETPHDHS